MAWEWKDTTTPEAEAAFVDRPLAGEVVLADPGDELTPALLGVALHAQILRGDVRWMPDLLDAAFAFIEHLRAEKKAARRTS